MLIGTTGALAAPALLEKLVMEGNAPAGLSAVEWAQIKSQLPQPAIATLSYTQQAYLKASNAETEDMFGKSVSINGDTLVVGAYWEDGSASGGESDNSAFGAGAAYVFVRSGTTWTQQAYLKASNAGSGDNFGYAVAVSGDTLVVGAYGEDSSASGGESDNSVHDAGAAYVFVRSGTTWTQEAYLKASSTDISDIFGFSVAIDGDTLVVGAHREDSSASGGESDNSATDSGAAYIFTRSGTAWTQEAILKASNAETDDDFSYTAVSIDGDSVVVGAPHEDSSASGGESDNSALNAGAVYVFTRSGTTWTQEAYLKASNAEAADYFGYSVAISGDSVVAGANSEDSSTSGGESDNSVNNAGAAYIFTRSGTTGVWTQQAYLKASNADAGDYFGYSVAISGDNAIIGAINEDSSASGGESDNSASNAGAAYLFTRSGTIGVWTQQAYLKASNAGSGDNFSYPVVIDGNSLVMGAEGEDSSASGGESDNSA
ncbi:MAG: hypothetical protein KAH28_17415, partial [Algiphilus sp.]|nr:hypothetical protein [Algiphilus sp.]